MTELPETVFPAHMGMTDAGPASISFGHAGTNGFVDITIGTSFWRVSASPEDLTTISQTAQDIRSNIRREEEAEASLREEDGSDGDA